MSPREGVAVGHRTQQLHWLLLQTRLTLKLPCRSTRWQTVAGHEGKVAMSRPFTGSLPFSKMRAGQQATARGPPPGSSACRVPLGPGSWDASLISPVEDMLLWGPHGAVR